MSADRERGIVYLPTGNPQPDHYGGAERGGRDYYGTSVVALDATTGEPRWRFQTVHHDVWDYDVAAQPVLFEQASGKAGVIATTKMGHVFLLDRESGEPLFPVEERAVPQSRVPGEHTAATQPFPTLPRPLHPHDLARGRDLGPDADRRKACREQFRKLKYEGIFTPPGFETTLAYPGLGGGMNWGSVSVNPATNVMIVNSMRVPYTVQLRPREEAAKLDGNDQVGANAQEGTPYIVIRGAYLSPWGTPCIAPPWGLLTAIDLDSGEVLWERPLGNLRNLAPLGVGRFFEWGGPNTGGSIQTASGLVFIGATLDGYFRAFDSATGEELWRHELPAPAQATPMTYRVSATGRQFVVIAAGGHKYLGFALGDVLIAYALPDGKTAPSRHAAPAAVAMNAPHDRAGGPRPRPSRRGTWPRDQASGSATAACATRAPRRWCASRAAIATASSDSAAVPVADAAEIAGLRTLLRDNGIRRVVLDGVMAQLPRCAFVAEQGWDRGSALRGGGAFGVDCFNVPHYRGDPATTVAEFADCLGPFCERAARAGITVALEFLPGTGIPDLERALRIVGGGRRAEPRHHPRYLALGADRRHARRYPRAASGRDQGLPAQRSRREPGRAARFRTVGAASAR